MDARAGAPLCFAISFVLANRWVSQPRERVHVEGRGREGEWKEWRVCWFPRAGPPRRRPGTEACRIRVPCICNEGCAPPTRRLQRGCARCIKAQPMADYRRSREQQFYAPRHLSSPGHWNAIPRADDLYLANARPRGRMSHVPSLCLYRSPSKISRSAEARYAWHVRTSTIGATIRLRIESERSIGWKASNTGLFSKISLLRFFRGENHLRESIRVWEN